MSQRKSNRNGTGKSRLGALRQFPSHWTGRRYKPKYLALTDSIVTDKAGAVYTLTEARELIRLGFAVTTCEYLLAALDRE